VTNLDQSRDGSVARRLLERLDRLSAAHPSSPDYLDGAGSAKPADRIRPLTDAEHGEHVAGVKARLDAAKAAGLSSDVLYTIDRRDEIWSPDQEEAHDALLAELYERASAVPCDDQAVVVGGLPGAGKTTVLREFAGIDLSQYLMINPDEIKAEMARRGMVPEVDGLTPMEASELVHEESSHLAKRLARMAQAEGKNVIWDVTMSKAESTEQRIQDLRAGGYTRLDGIFVDTPVDVAVMRADSRHRQDHDAYRAGEGPGGRLLPDRMIQAQADGTWGSINRANFERVKDSFDAWTVYDNSADGAPVLIATSGEPRMPDRPRRDL